MYITEFNNKNTSEAARYLVSGFMLKGLIKAYKDFDVRVLDGIDHVFIFARHIGHKLYYRIINEVRKREIPVSYVSKVNEDLAVKEIKNARTGREVC